MREQIIDLWTEAASRLKDPLPSRRTRRPGFHGTQCACRRRRGPHLRTPIAAVGIGSRVEDLGCDGIQAATLARRTSDQSPVYVIGYPE
ncbi:hypothetical protein MFM001_16200 [Mycobacterium sp. MFM001]|nr:hypothetical protein MFM001_16200 [Mycobacterium sp. MFM001]